MPEKKAVDIHNQSPQERFKSMVEEVVSNALWDFGLRQNDFDFEGGGFLKWKTALQRDKRYHYKAETDFLGHEKTILNDIKLIPKRTSDFKNHDTFLIKNMEILGLDDSDKINSIIKAILNACKSLLKKEHDKNIKNYDWDGKISAKKVIDPKGNCHHEIEYWVNAPFTVQCSYHLTNAHKITSIPENAYDIVEEHLKNAIRKYFGIEVQASQELTQQPAKFTTIIDEETSSAKWKSEQKALESSKSHQFQRLVKYGMVAAEEFREAAQEIGEWQSHRIAELPLSIKHSISMCDVMKDYKTLSADERAQVASQMMHEIGNLQKSIKRDVVAISDDCETTDEAVDILAEHRNNMQRYAQGIRTVETRLNELFGSAAVGEKIGELDQIVAHTGIQVAQQTAIHQSYNTATLKQISQLSGKMDALSGSVTRLSIAIKLRDMLSEDGVVRDIAVSTLEQLELQDADIRDFQTMDKDALDDIIDGEAIHIFEEVEPIATKGQDIEQLMIEGKAADQLYLPSPETFEETDEVNHG